MGFWSSTGMSFRTKLTSNSPRAGIQCSATSFPSKWRLTRGSIVRRWSLANSQPRDTCLRERLHYKRSVCPGDDDGSVGVEVDRSILAVGKVAEPFPTLAAIGAHIHACDRGHDLPVRSRRVDVDAIGSEVGACLVG